MIKQIGTLAREELQGLLGEPIFLELFVRVAATGAIRRPSCSSCGGISRRSWRMSEARIEAVILKQQDYRENDALITVLSKDYGKLGFVCRGIRKMASKNAVSCMPFVLSELMFDYKEQATLFSLKSARVLAAHRHIREDLEKMTIAQVMCEIADKLLEQGESDLEAAGELYELLSVSLDRLDSEADSYLILAQFTALALKPKDRAGYRRVRAVLQHPGA